MKKKDFQNMQWPTIVQLEAELKRERKVCGRRFFLKGLATILVLTFLTAFAVAFVWMPVLHINGDSMAPTLTNGEIVAAYTGSEIETGDIIAFYYNNKLLVKRVIAIGGDVVSVDRFGNVTVNNQLIDEPYVSGKSQGECDIDMPYTVPSGRLFVMGDRRSESLDSRSTAIGCVAKEQILGRVFVQLWPLERIQWIGKPLWN